MKMQSKLYLRCLIYFCLTLLVACLVFPMLSRPGRGPSFETQRKEQRKIVQQRVLAAGGWAAVRGACNSLTTNLPHDYFYWRPPVTNAQVTWFSNNGPAGTYVTNLDYGPLPAPLATLQPRTVEFDVVTNDLTVVKIELFGMHRTGAWDVPYYGIYVVCGVAPLRYQPAVEGPGHFLSEVSERVFEVYQ
jgi:hypothetical protein